MTALDIGGLACDRFSAEQGHLAPEHTLPGRLQYRLGQTRTVDVTVPE